jgi:hypothetical protein
MVQCAHVTLYHQAIEVFAIAIRIAGAQVFLNRNQRWGWQGCHVISLLFLPTPAGEMAVGGIAPGCGGGH